MASSKTDIFNLAATILGAAPISSPTENSKIARAFLAVDEIVRQSELRKKPYWNFAIKMASLAANATPPLFSRANAFPLPADFICLAPSFKEMNYNDKDWLIQNGQIFTNWDAPLQIRYVADITDISEMDPLFQHAYAAKLAETAADAVTQSNSKIQLATARYKEIILEARKANAFDNVSTEFPEDTYLTVRL